MRCWYASDTHFARTCVELWAQTTTVQVDIGGSTRRCPAVPPRSGSPSPGRVRLRPEMHLRVLQDRVRALELDVLFAQPFQLFAPVTRQSGRAGGSYRPRPACIPKLATTHGGLAISVRESG